MPEQREETGNVVQLSCFPLPPSLASTNRLLGSHSFEKLQEKPNSELESESVQVSSTEEGQPELGWQKELCSPTINGSL